MAPRRALLLLAACLALAALAAADYPPATKCKKTQGELSGGWATTSDIPKEVKAAIAKAVDKKLSKKFCPKTPSIKILTACSQVVAGFNYEVVVKMQCSKPKKCFKVSAIVWQKPDMSTEVTKLVILKKKC